MGSLLITHAFQADKECNGLVIGWQLFNRTLKISYFEALMLLGWRVKFACDVVNRHVALVSAVFGPPIDIYVVQNREKVRAPIVDAVPDMLVAERAD